MGVVEMRIKNVRRGFKVFLVVAVFLGLQLLLTGMAPAADPAAPQITAVEPSRDTGGEVATNEDDSSSGLGFGISNVTPNQAVQYTPFIPPYTTLTITIDGMPGFPFVPVVALQSGETGFPIGTGTLSGYDISCVAFINAPPGVYDVVIISGVGQAVLPDAFTVLPNPICGAGSGSAVLMLGMTMGLLSLAGSGGLLRRRRRKSR
jgi:hypothetical protein